MHQAPSPVTAHKTFRLSELTGSIERMFRQYYEEKLFYVLAEVVDHKYYPAKQHHYLSLVEKEGGSIIAKVSAVAWKEGNARLQHFEEKTGQPFTNNIKVLLRVCVDYSSVHGLKLVIKDISAEYTMGALQQERLRTLERLTTEFPEYIQRRGERMHTSNMSLPLPVVLQRIAIVSSSASAGLEDFQHTLANNPFGHRFQTDTVFVPVQGVDNAGAICRQLDALVESGQAYDAVVIIRGGGAQIDFLVFDDFEICLRIARLPFPVITGIGHQKDETIADMMAHLSLKTPTQVAEFLIGHNRKFEEEMVGFRNSIIIKTQYILSSANAGIARINTVIVNPRATLSAFTSRGSSTSARWCSTDRASFSCAAAPSLLHLALRSRARRPSVLIRPGCGCSSNSRTWALFRKPCCSTSAATSGITSRSAGS